MENILVTGIAILAVVAAFPFGLFAIVIVAFIASAIISTLGLEVNYVEGIAWLLTYFFTWISTRLRAARRAERMASLSSRGAQDRG
jgi:hypothetical protein